VHDEDIKESRLKYKFISFFFSGEIDSQRNEIADIERSIRSMQNDMTKLNVLIHKNRDMHESLQQDNILMEHDFISALKVIIN